MTPKGSPGLSNRVSRSQATRHARGSALLQLAFVQRGQRGPLIRKGLGTIHVLLLTVSVGSRKGLLLHVG